MAMHNFDIIVLGSGPGGYVGAIRATQLGMKVAIVEKDELGGVCLNRGCIPTKSLLKSAELLNDMKRCEEYGIETTTVKAHFNKVMDRSYKVAEKMSKGVSFLMQKNKITVIKGHAELQGEGAVKVISSSGTEQIINAKHIIVATGGRARSLPSVIVDEKKVITYKTALRQNTCPKKLLVIGAGAIGVEFAYFYRSMGSEVIVVEYQDQLLPIEDHEVSKELLRSFKKQKIKSFLSTTVKAVTACDEGVKVLLSGNKDQNTEELIVDQVLVAVGVQGNVENIGLEKLGITTEGSFIKVNSQYETSQKGVYAIGDVIGAPLLAHVASAEAIKCVEWISGLDVPEINYDHIPGCTYCHPQVASIGLTEKKAAEKNIDVNVGKFPFMASGKASAIGDNTGFVKKIFDKKYNQLLGVHIIGPEATELIAASSIALSHEATAESVLHTIHAHPTLSEALMEAAADGLDEAIHL